MNRLNTTSVSLAVTPTVISTLFSHYLKRKPLKERPTAHLSYDEGLHLIRSFLDFVSHHTVEDLQAFTAQRVPHPQWVKVQEVDIGQQSLDRSAQLLELELGPDGIRQVGGRLWWQWRKPACPLQAEWIEMRSHAHERKKQQQQKPKSKPKPNPTPTNTISGPETVRGDGTQRVIMYIHGGAFFFGSVDVHRYQMQRHARKLRACVFAPRYRLAPQFPFPCGLQDCLAAYLQLLSMQDPSTIILAGDSAGAGMAISLMCILRNQNIPLPAGAILISPWVDLTHSFPSVAGDAPLDYIPQAGFHHKPSRAWPPLNDHDLAQLRDQACKSDQLSQAQEVCPPGTHTEPNASQAGDAHVAASSGSNHDASKFLSITIDGELFVLKDQIQMYATNALLSHPLVSPVMQPTLGGLPPMLIMTGGGEILRDEQIYLAHKCANPTKYAPPATIMTDRGREQLKKYKPTDVQLQVWDDLCHVAPTLSFTRPAKYMYRAVAQFGAWALARAQHVGIEITDDDEISVITSSASDAESLAEGRAPENEEKVKKPPMSPGQVGNVGDPLPPFKKHMIRQRVTRHGVTIPLAPESELPGCCMDPAEVGLIKEGPVRKWLEARRRWETRYATIKAKVHKRIAKDMATGYHDFGPDEHPPPSALAGRRLIQADLGVRKKTKSIGLAMWSLWGWKHDEAAVQREEKLADHEPRVRIDGSAERGSPSGAHEKIDGQEKNSQLASHAMPHSLSHCRTVIDENQTGCIVAGGITTDAAAGSATNQDSARSEKLDPRPTVGMGVTGKRPFIGGIAMPFSLKKEAETASMVTLSSTASSAKLMQSGSLGRP